MSGSPTFDTEKKQTRKKNKKNRNGANLKLRHTLRAGGVKRTEQRYLQIDLEALGLPKEIQVIN